MKYLLLFISVLFYNNIVALNDTLNKYEIIENLFESLDLENINEDLFNLEDLLDLEINLNSAKEIELSQLPFLSSFLIQNLLEYRKKNGSLISFWEILEIEGFDKELIKKLKAFCTLEKVENNFSVHYFNDISNRIDFRWRFLLEEREGKNKGIYNGDKHKVFLRYTFKGSKNLRFGITAEKDEYECFGKENNPYGFDFYSSFLEIKKINKKLDLIIGDYHSEFGQGLVLWSSFRFNRTLNDVYLPNSKGFKPHVGTDENRFFRGFSCQFDFKKVQLYLMASDKKIDASLYNDTIKSFLNTGLHRTKSEIERENTVKKTDFAGTLEYKYRIINIGIISKYTRFNKIVFPDYQLYNHHIFLGKENFTASVFYNTKLFDINFFGEEAIANNGGFSTFNGFYIMPSPEFKILISHRYISKNYNSFYSNFFSSSSNVSEQGFYFNVSIEPLNKLKIVAYFDTYKYLWLRFGMNDLYWGRNMAGQTIYKINDFSSITFRYNNVDIPTDLGFENRQNFRFQFDINKNKIHFRTRIENVNYRDRNNETQKGYLLYQNIKINLPDYKKIIFYARYVLFNSKNWNSRIYAYEDDFIGTFNTNIHYMRGHRFYIMVKYDISKEITFWIKTSQTHYPNEINIGVGNDLINSNKMTEFKFQLNIKI